jgi:eukaryotic-like serine/threonine-protein kinase
VSENHKRDADDGPAPLAPGVPIAPGYTVIELLRRGNALDVYDVWSEERDCRCVAKILRPDRCADRMARERLRHEGRLLVGFSHPHLVRAYEFINRPSPVLILETLTGETLGHLIATRRRRLPVRDIAFLGIHLCSALHYLHRHTILHLDIKPSNIMAECGTAKLMDLSIARPPGPGRRGIGTPQYMAPEQVRGDLLSAATDVWGVGGVLFEAITGERPSGAHDGSALEGTERESLLDTLRARRRLPRNLTHLVERCLALDPAARPSVAELACGLKDVAKMRRG